MHVYNVFLLESFSLGLYISSQIQLICVTKEKNVFNNVSASAIKEIRVSYNLLNLTLFANYPFRTGTLLILTTTTTIFFLPIGGVEITLS